MPKGQSKESATGLSNKGNKSTLAAIFLGLASAALFGDVFNTNKAEDALPQTPECRIEHPATWESASLRSSYLDINKVLGGLGLKGASLNDLQAGTVTCDREINQEQIYKLNIKVAGNIGNCLVIGLATPEYSLEYTSKEVEAICKTQPEGYLV